MVREAGNNHRREESLSRDRIIEVSIELLDGSGEGGLTFRSLSERLATGPGAIYWHIANKSELLIAACDAVITRTLEACAVGPTSEATIRVLALGMFDAIDAHPWIGTALTRAQGRQPIVRIVERLGQPLSGLGVPDGEQWATVSALMNYILGVAGGNAANTKLAQKQGAERSDFLDKVAAAWSQLDPDEYPFARSVAGQLRSHDDRIDFLSGVDIILRGIRGMRSDPTGGA
jgi:AcrR family transcriptional regulator